MKFIRNVGKVVLVVIINEKENNAEEGEIVCVHVNV